jgi:hypothetical protein
MADNFNPFGLVGQDALRRQRQEETLQQFNQGQQGLSGIGRGSHAIGFSLAKLLKAGANRAGLTKDSEMRRASEVTSATKRAETAYRSIPDELKETDPFGSAIQRRKELVSELSAAGLDNEADTVRQQIMTLSEQQEKFLKSRGERVKQDVDIEQARFDLEASKRGAREKDETIRLQNELENLDLSDPVQAARADTITARLNKLTSITGTTEFDPSASDKVTIRKVEDSLFQNQDTLDGFMQSQESFDPTFLTVGGKIKNWAFRAADIAGFDLPEEQKQELREFTAFKQRTSTNLNAYIKAITGAQMSNPEAVRLRKDVPTEDDSPTAYKEKMDNVILKLTAVRARTLAALEHIDDRRKFNEVRTKPLAEFMEQAKSEVAEQIETQTLAEAEAALLNLENLLQGPQ